MAVNQQKAGQRSKLGTYREMDPVSRPERSDSFEELESRIIALKTQLDDLATMGTVITAILEIDAVLSVTMDTALRLVDGEVGLILIHEAGELKPKVTWGVGEPFVRSLMYADDMDLAAYVYSRRETVLLADLDLKSPEGIVLDSVIACPIQTRETCFGVMILINKANGGNFAQEDKENLGRLLNFVAVAVENSQLVRSKLEKQRIDQEMAIAKQIQETILPHDIGNIRGASVGAVYFPAGEVGGDFYEVLKLGDHQFMVIIGDVSNKGVPAAMVMSACSAIIKTTLASEPNISVADLAARINTLMVNEIIREREMFVTLFFSKFDMASRTLTYCNAGHMPGLFWDDRNQKIEDLADGGPIVGQFPDMTYTEGSRDLLAGDRLFLYTDGLTEAMDINGNLFGRERAEQVLTAEIGLAPAAFCLRVKEWVDRFTEGAPRDAIDDFTVLQVMVEKGRPDA